MRVGQAKELFRQLTQQYFNGAEVIMANQSRRPKPETPLVVIDPGNVRRSTAPNMKYAEEYSLGYYYTKMPIVVDLFTNGAPVKDEDGNIIAYEDNAMDEILAYADFLNSISTLEWCRLHDVTILIDGEAMDLTGLVNDTTYEYRARLTVQFYFTHVAVGKAAVFDEGSIKFPTGETDPDTDEPIVTPDPPIPGEDIFPGGNEDNDKDDPIVQPEKPGTDIGGSGDIADQEVGYFTDVEIKEEKFNE